MNYALCITDCIRRWRHTRGYGVHSPLAYRIVKECIRPDRRYGFYCDAYLDFEYHEDRRGLRRARMIIRLLHQLRPAYVWMPDSDKRIVTAIRIIMPKLRIATQKECPKGTDFIITYYRKDIAALWHKMDAIEECEMLALGSTGGSPQGATLEIKSKDYLLLLRRPGMQKVKYDV